MKTLNLPNRIYSQYATKPKFRDWMNITRELGDEIANGAKSVREMLDIDKATGESLEIIGRIVVIERLRSEILMNAGVFADPDGTQSGDTDHTFSEWSTLNDDKLSDEMLRLAIRAKIIKNTSICTQDDLLKAFNFLFPNAGAFRLINHHDMSFSIEFIGELSKLELWLINVSEVIPTPQGVRFRGFTSSVGIIEFLDDDGDVFGDEKMEFME